MDENKREVLKQIGYEIRPTCSTCKYSKINTYGFGECQKHQYVHKKHTGPARQLSIYESGWCPSYEASADLEETLHGFNEFVKKG